MFAQICRILVKVGVAYPFRFAFPLVVGLHSSQENFPLKHQILTEIGSEISASVAPIEHSDYSDPPFGLIMRQVEKLLLELNRIANL